MDNQRREKKLVRRVDFRLMPILFISYGLQYYDKSMISQAALFGFREDLSLTIGNRYSFAASIFYLGFVVGSYPAIYLAQRFPIERVISGIVLLWGICLTCTAACTNYEGIFAQRFFLGFLEAGVSPAFMLVVGGWYKRQEQAFRMGIWYSATGYTFMFSPLINYGLGHITGSLSPWRYMYIVAGCVTVLWSVVILLFMPPDPIRAKGLTDRQRYIAVARMSVNNSGVMNTHFKEGQVWELLLDVKFWLIVIIAFLMLPSNGPTSTYIPIIISDLGFSDLNALLLILPTGFVVGTIQLISTYCAMKFIGWRTYIVAMCECGTLLGCLLLWQLPLSATGARLFGTYLLAANGGGYAVLMSLQIANIAGYTKRSMGSSGLFIGYCFGNFLGPLLFFADEAPYYNTGWWVIVMLGAVGVVLILVYRFVLVWENRRRDMTGEMEGYEHAYEDDLTDKTNPQFRYTL